MQSTTAHTLAQQFSAAVEAMAAVSTKVADFRSADDAGLVELSRLAAREKQLADAHLALIAGEIAARSTREMGQSGLAQREGFRSPEEFLQVTTGATGRDAVSAVRVGRLVRDASLDGEIDPATGEPFEAREPWLSSVAAAVLSGGLTVGAAEAIRTGLGTPTENVPAAVLAGAAQQLCAEAAALHPDRLLKRARELRDELDESGILDREHERVERRSLRHFMLASGMGRFVWDLDPESYATLVELYNRATSPKRGVRFVSGDHKETAERILADPRTIAQLASDTMLGLVQAGAGADSSQLLGAGAAVIRVLVTQASLDSLEGHGHIEGLTEPISIETVERLSCDGGSRVVTFDEAGQPLDVGREQRFFTKKQRIALAVRDGGCVFGNCDKPPSMTEAHHIAYWARDKGRTNVRDGVCLCKFHHLLIHNNGWEIRRVAGRYYLIPPGRIDPDQQAVPMRSTSAALDDLRRQSGIGVEGGVG